MNKPIRRRGFYIPMFITLGISSVANLLFLFLGISIFSELVTAHDIGAVILLLFGTIIMIPLAFASMVLAVPSLVLGMIFLNKIKGTNIEKSPSVVAVTLSTIFLVTPFVYIILLGLL